MGTLKALEIVFFTFSVLHHHFAEVYKLFELYVFCMRSCSEVRTFSKLDQIKSLCHTWTQVKF